MTVCNNGIPSPTLFHPLNGQVESRPIRAIGVLLLLFGRSLQALGPRCRTSNVLAIGAKQARASQALHARRAFEAKYSEEDRREFGRQMNLKAAQKLLDCGQAATIKQALSLKASQANKAAAQKLVDRGAASTLAEARSLRASRAACARAQKLVDDGNVTTLQEAYSLFGTLSVHASAQKLVNKGQADTLQDAINLNSARLRQAYDDRYDEGERYELGIQAGAKSAQQTGKHIRFPGVHWEKKLKKWRVRFRYQEKRISAGCFEDEEEAARAHDAYVKTHNLNRPLHFPDIVAPT